MNSMILQFYNGSRSFLYLRYVYDAINLRYDLIGDYLAKIIECISQYAVDFDAFQENVEISWFLKKF